MNPHEGPEITVFPFVKDAASAAQLLSLLIPSLRWRWSWLVPGAAVWTLNGEPIEPRGSDPVTEG